MKKDRPGCFSLPRRSASYTMQSTWSIPLIRQSCTALFECDADIIAGMTERSKKKFRKKIKKPPPKERLHLKSGGTNWIRTSDPHDVNVVL